MGRAALNSLISHAGQYLNVRPSGCWLGSTSHGTAFMLYLHPSSPFPTASLLSSLPSPPAHLFPFLCSLPVCSSLTPLLHVCPPAWNVLVPIVLYLFKALLCLFSSSRLSSSATLPTSLPRPPDWESICSFSSVCPFPFHFHFLPRNFRCNRPQARGGQDQCLIFSVPKHCYLIHCRILFYE